MNERSASRKNVSSTLGLTQYVLYLIDMAVLEGLRVYNTVMPKMQTDAGTLL